MAMERTNNPITEQMAASFDCRKYSHMISFLERHCTEEQYENYKRLIVFNKDSIVFDKDSVFTFCVQDIMDNGCYSIWPYYNNVLICEELEVPYAVHPEEIEGVIESILYYIRTRI